MQLTVVWGHKYYYYNTIINLIELQILMNQTLPHKYRQYLADSLCLIIMATNCSFQCRANNLDKQVL